MSSSTTNQLSEKQQQALTEIKKSLVELGLDKKLDKNDYEGEVLRFAKTKSFNVSGTIQMIKKFTEWKEKINYDSLTIADIKDIIFSNAFVYMGRAKNGMEAFVVFPARHIPGTLDCEQLGPGMALMMQCALKAMGGKGDQLIFLFDYENWGLTSVDSTMDSTILTLGQEYFPERLYKAFLVKPPWYFSTIWKILKPFLDNQTMIFLDEGNYQEELNKWFTPENLLKQFGGKAEETMMIDYLLKYLSDEQKKLPEGLTIEELRKTPKAVEEKKKSMQEGWFSGFWGDSEEKKDENPEDKPNEKPDEKGQQENNVEKKEEQSSSWFGFW